MVIEEGIGCTDQQHDPCVFVVQKRCSGDAEL